MKELLARVLFMLIGHVLWVLRRHDRLTYTEDDGANWEAEWWIFHEHGSTVYDSVTRNVLGIGVWRWNGEYRITRWTGRRLHFAYRHSFRSGKGICSFFKHLGIAYRLGL